MGPAKGKHGGGKLDVELKGGSLPRKGIHGGKFGFKMPHLSFGGKQKSGSFDVECPDVNVNGPDVDVKGPKVDVDLDVNAPDVDVEGGGKGKGKFGFKMPHIGFGGKGSAGGDVDVNVEGPDVDVKGPKVDVDLDVNAPDVDVEGGGKGKFGFKMPHIGFGG